MPHRKMETLNFIKDGVWSQLQGWNGRLFSIGGKEVLLKAVIQAIPCYSMNCFKIPARLLYDISMSMARFLWGENSEDRRIHWVSWETMCRPKCLGGMGFKDLVSFNKSLLAKQGWRLIRNLTSLLALALKGRYFKNKTFTEATLGNSSSYIWRSLL